MFFDKIVVIVMFMGNEPFTKIYDWNWLKRTV